MTNLMKLSVIALLAGTLALVGCGDDAGDTGGTGATGATGGTGGGAGGMGGTGGAPDPLADACMDSTGTPVEGIQYVTCAINDPLELTPSLPVQIKIVPDGTLTAGQPGSACYASAVNLDVGIPVAAEIASGESIVAITGVMGTDSITLPIPTGTFDLPAELVFPEETFMGTVGDVTEITVDISEVNTTAVVAGLNVVVPCTPGWCGEGVPCVRDGDMGPPIVTVPNDPISIPVSPAL